MSMSEKIGSGIGAFVAHFVIGAGFASGVLFVLWLGGYLVGASQ